jgi:folate-dependent phosphoribosylglycinamide formyltransferase PurN
MGFMDHAWTRWCVQSLLKGKYPPIAVIEEESPMAAVKGTFWNETLAQLHTLPPTVSEQIRQHNATSPPERQVEYVHVTLHNNDTCYAKLQELKPELMLLGTTRIIKERILMVPSAGVLNVHPGLLPGYRGALVWLRQIVDDIPLGMTCHWAAVTLDSGGIAYTTNVTVHEGDRVSDLMAKLLTAAGSVLETAVVAFGDSGGDAKSIPNHAQLNPMDHPCFNWPEDVPALVAQCESKMSLEAGTPGAYKHIIPRPAA